MLEVRHLSKSFGGVKATDDVSLSFADGSLTAVIGPNGAGKSTFFNLITGALKPDSGQILLDGVEMVGRASPPDIVRHGIGRAFQVASIFPSLTVHETMLAAVCADQRRASVLHRRFPLRRNPRPRRAGDGNAGSRRQARSRSRRRCRMATRSCSILRSRWCSSPRCCCSTSRPPAWDRKSAGAMIDKVHELWERQKITVVFIEHDMDIVFKIAPAIRRAELWPDPRQGTPTRSAPTRR